MDKSGVAGILYADGSEEISQPDRRYAAVTKSVDVQHSNQTNFTLPDARFA